MKKQLLKNCKKNMAFGLMCMIVFFACNSTKKNTTPASTSTENAQTMSDTSTIEKCKVNLEWNEKTRNNYLKICSQSAKLNDKIDQNKFCKCLVELFESNNVSPSETDKFLEKYQTEIQTCAKNSLK